MSRSGIILAGAILLLFIVVLTGRSLLSGYLDTPLPPTTQNQVYSIPPGASLNQAAAALNEQGILPAPDIFVLWGRWTGQASRIKAGEYQIPANATPRILLEQMVAGQALLHSFTILEGWTIYELLAALAEVDTLEHQLIDIEVSDLGKLLDLPYDYPEGLFFPDTYQFPRGYKDTQLLGNAAKLMATRLDEAWENRATDVPLQDKYALLTLASIVEAETGLESERAEVAGVFVRRLNKGMLLQTDPTVIYGIGPDFNGNLTRRDLQTDTPYNTYTRKGLPPTPIGMPSAGALAAAGNPATGTAMYFVALGDGSGGHEFSDTLEQHNAAVARYLKRLRDARNNPSGSSSP